MENTFIFFKFYSHKLFYENSLIISVVTFVTETDIGLKSRLIHLPFRFCKRPWRKQLAHFIFIRKQTSSLRTKLFAFVNFLKVFNLTKRVTGWKPLHPKPKESRLFRSSLPVSLHRYVRWLVYCCHSYFIGVLLYYFYSPCYNPSCCD
jgi:hypothetical protein